MILVRNIRLPLSAGEPQAFEKALREARIPRAKASPSWCTPWLSP